MAHISGKIDLRVDMDLLKKQKRLLMRLIADFEQKGEEPTVELLEGLLNLLDHIHDTVDLPMRATNG